MPTTLSRHPRESGDPEEAICYELNIDHRLRGDDIGDMVRVAHSLATLNLDGNGEENMPMKVFKTD